MTCQRRQGGRDAWQAYAERLGGGRVPKQVEQRQARSSPAAPRFGLWSALLALASRDAPMPPLELNDSEMSMLLTLSARSISACARSSLPPWRKSSRRSDKPARLARVRCTGWRARFRGAFSTLTCSEREQGGARLKGEVQSWNTTAAPRFMVPSSVLALGQRYVPPTKARRGVVGMRATPSRPP
jgi:hypothetical protein